MKWLKEKTAVTDIKIDRCVYKSLEEETLAVFLHGFGEQKTKMGNKEYIQAAEKLWMLDVQEHLKEQAKFSLVKKQLGLEEVDNILRCRGSGDLWQGSPN